MLKNRRAQSSTMTLEHLVNLLLGLVIFIFIVAFLATIYFMLTSDEPNLYESDFKRVKSDIDAINHDVGKVHIPIFSDEMTFILKKTGDIGQRGCGPNKLCLCYMTKEDTSKEICEELNKDINNYDIINPETIVNKITVKTHVLNYRLNSGALEIS